MIYYRNVLFTINVHELISGYMFLLCYNCVKYGHITSKEQVSFYSKYSLGGVLSSKAGGSGLTWRTLSTTICSINSSFDSVPQDFLHMATHYYKIQLYPLRTYVSATASLI